MTGCASRAESGGGLGTRDEAAKDAAAMIARAKAAAKASEGPGVSVLHEVCSVISLMDNMELQKACKPHNALQRSALYSLRCANG